MIILGFLIIGSHFGCELQTKGMALVPKRVMDVMACEVNRLLQLTKNAVVPMPLIVPRKVSV